MVGTPNHGSELARFRFVMEIKDQFRNLFQEDTHWLQGLLDGTGAAGIDLIPGSEFLDRLNSRSHPEGVDLHVIAGVISPWSDLDVLRPGPIKKNEKGLTGKKRSEIMALEVVMDSVSGTLGDGLVTVDSAMLDKIPFTRVQGNHLTMIRNLSRDSKRIPPAIPVILEILNRDTAGSSLASP